MCVEIYGDEYIEHACEDILEVSIWSMHGEIIGNVYRACVEIYRR